jgi:hypothetical protein
MVPAEGIEPPTFGLQNRCSTAELSRHANKVRYLSGRLSAKTRLLPPGTAYHRSPLVRNAASMAATAALSSAGPHRLIGGVAADADDPRVLRHADRRRSGREPAHRPRQPDRHIEHLPPPVQEGQAVPMCTGPSCRESWLDDLPHPTAWLEATSEPACGYAVDTLATPGPLCPPPRTVLWGAPDRSAEGPRTAVVQGSL